MTENAAEIVAQAVRAYRSGDDEGAWLVFEGLRRQIALEPEAGLAAAKPYVTSESANERGAAALIIGYLVSLQLRDAGAESAELLLGQLAIEPDASAREDLATGLGHIWNACDGRGTALMRASDPNPNVRYAAAKNLSFTTTDRPGDADARAALEILRDDPDAEVRSWAELGFETLSLD